MRSRSRRRFLQGSLALAGLGLLSGCEVAWSLGRQPPRVPVVGFLSPGPREARARVDAGFLQGLRDLGYVEGQTIAIEYRYADSNDRLPDLAAELAALPVDLILAAAGTPAALAAKRASATIPIVFTSVGDPVATGLVASLARPGGNITGLTNVAAVLAGKRGELLKAIVPGLSRLAVILNQTNPVHPSIERDTAAALQVLGIQMQALWIRSPADFEGAFQSAAGAGADAVNPVSDPLVTNARDQLADFPPRMSSGKTRRPVGCSLMVRASSICFGVPRPTSTRSSRAPSRPICRSSSRPGSTSWSTSRRRRRSG